jgi:hypothetical protein
MSCQLDVATEVKQDILDCNAGARRQIGDFLLGLQENPLPKNRRHLGRAKNDSAFYVQLPCGFYVSWEIIGNMMHLALTGETEGILVRILGVARVLRK